MTTSTIARFIFVLLFCASSQIASSLLAPETVPMDDRRRFVHYAAENDPCLKVAPWINTEAGAGVGKALCKAVLTMFIGLDDNERKGCPNALDADCQCHGFLRSPRCTFTCKMEEIDWTAPPIKKSKWKPYERQKKTEQRERLLLLIAANVENPDKPLPARAPPIALIQNQLTASRLGPWRGDGTLKSFDSRKRKSPEP